MVGYPRTTWIYTILDNDKYEEYMKNKNHRIRNAIDYAVSAKITISQSARIHGYHWESYVLNHSAKLQKMGIIEKKLRVKPRPPPKEARKKTLRKRIRQLLMTARYETLEKNLIMLESEKI